MRRAPAPADYPFAVCGGQNKKAPNRLLLNPRIGLGPWQTLGPRRLARQDVTPQAVGFDSRAVQPYYTRLSIGALKCMS